MRKTISGFTIIELVVVITVIAILTALGVYSFNRVQATARDSQRSTKVTAITETLEKYYNQNGNYPSCADMSASPNTVVVNTLINLKADTLTTPTAASGVNSILANCADMAAGYTLDSFAYVGRGSGASTCLNTACMQWSFKYREESSGNIISLASRHVAP